LVAQRADGRTDRTQVVDLDGDGFADIAFDDQLGVHVAMALGDGTFRPPSTVAPFPRAWLFRDDDGDGVPDLLLTDDQQQLTLARGKGDGTFDVARPFVSPVPTYEARADFDGDGRDDYIVRTDSAIQVVSSAVGYAVTEQMPFFAGPPVQGMSALALGMAARWALLIAFGDGSVDVHAIGTGDLATVVTTLARSPSAAADFNGDGLTDLMVGQVVAFGQGDGNFTSDASGPAIDVMGVLKAADFDGDGNVDLKELSLEVTETQVWTWRGTGNGHFVKAGPVYIPGGLSLHEPVRRGRAGASDLLVTVNVTEIRLLRGDCP
jgi:hypothetical protein